MNYFCSPAYQRRFIMRINLLFLLLLAAVMQLSAKGYSQITLNMNNATLSEVFLEIRKQSGYDFFYNERLIEDAKLVNVQVTNQPIESVLDVCLENADLAYAIKNNIVIIKGKPARATSLKPIADQNSAASQTLNVIRGKVMTSQGFAIHGASIRVDDAAQRTMTNTEGLFELRTPLTKGTITVTFIGYKTQQVSFGENQELSITMEDDVSEMEEVIVNGLFTQNRNSYTGSVTTLSADDILAISSTDLLKALSILTPGMRIVENNEMGSNPNHVPEIIIRGMTSIASQDEYGLNTPLIIMDGVEISLTQLYDLDIFEIERVDVLKDASATSLYGEKAANGVIVIERKRVTDRNVQLRYNFVPTFEFPDVSSYNYTNAAQKLELERLAGLYVTADGSLDQSYNEKFQRIQRGVNTNWMAKPLRNTASFNHSLSMSGRGGGMDYSVTARFGDTRGVMKNDYRGNYGVGFYFSYRLVDKFTVTYRADINQTSSQNSPYGTFSDYVIINPYDTPYDEFGQWNKTLSYNFRNPLYDATTSSFDKALNKNITNNLSMRWDILKGFYTTGSFSYTMTDAQSDRFLSPDRSNFENETDPGMRGSYNISNSAGKSWQGLLGLTYNKALGGAGSVLTLNVGASANQNNSKSSNFSGIGFLKGTLTDMAFANSYPVNGRPGGTESLSASVGLYSNVNVIFSNRYFMDGAYRISGSSKFGKERRFAPFWSVGLGWNAHNESFIENTGIFDILRIRGSLGYTGSVNFSDYQAITTYRYSQDNNYLIGMGALPITMGNDDLKWQTTIKYNVGTTVEMFNGRLSGNFDLYRENTTDLLLSVSTPPSIGVLNVMDNLGETLNWGYEWQVSGMVLKRNHLYWRMGISGHHTENKLMKISNAMKRQNDSSMGDLGVTAPRIQLEEGESATAIYAVRSLGIDPATGREIFIKKDGTYTFEYDVNDKIALGNTVPYAQGALTSAFGYKGFSVSAAISFTFGGDVYNSTRASKVERINPRENVDVRAFTERWKNPGDVVHYTALTNYRDFVHSQRFIERKNEVYLSSLNFSYELNPAWVKSFGLKRLRVGVGFSEVLRLTTVKYERGTSYPYSKGYNFTISPIF